MQYVFYFPDVCFSVMLAIGMCRVVLFNITHRQNRGFFSISINPQSYMWNKKYNHNSVRLRNVQTGGTEVVDDVIILLQRHCCCGESLRNVSGRTLSASYTYHVWIVINLMKNGKAKMNYTMNPHTLDHLIVSMEYSLRAMFDWDDWLTEKTNRIFIWLDETPALILCSRLSIWLL